MERYVTYDKRMNMFKPRFIVEGPLAFAYVEIGTRRVNNGLEHIEGGNNLVDITFQRIDESQFESIREQAMGTIDEKEVLKRLVRFATNGRLID